MDIDKREIKNTVDLSIWPYYPQKNYQLKTKSYIIIKRTKQTKQFYKNMINNSPSSFQSSFWHSRVILKNTNDLDTAIQQSDVQPDKDTQDAINRIKKGICIRWSITEFFLNTFNSIFNPDKEKKVIEITDDQTTWKVAKGSWDKYQKAIQHIQAKNPSLNSGLLALHVKGHMNSQQTSLIEKTEESTSIDKNSPVLEIVIPATHEDSVPVVHEIEARPISLPERLAELQELAKAKFIPPTQDKPAPALVKKIPYQWTTLPKDAQEVALSFLSSDELVIMMKTSRYNKDLIGTILLKKAACLGATDEELALITIPEAFLDIIRRCEIEEVHRRANVTMIMEVMQEVFGKDCPRTPETIYEFPSLEDFAHTQQQHDKLVKKLLGIDKLSDSVGGSVKSYTFNISDRYFDTKKYSWINYYLLKLYPTVDEERSPEEAEIARIDFIKNLFIDGMKFGSEEEILALIENPEQLRKRIEEAPARAYGFTDKEIAIASKTPGGVTKLIRSAHDADQCVKFCEYMWDGGEVWLDNKLLNQAVNSLKKQGEKFPEGMEWRIVHFNFLDVQKTGRNRKGDDITLKSETGEPISLVDPVMVGGALLLKIAGAIKEQLKQPEYQAMEQLKSFDIGGCLYKRDLRIKRQLKEIPLAINLLKGLTHFTIYFGNKGNDFPILPPLFLPNLTRLAINCDIISSNISLVDIPYLDTPKLESLVIHHVGFIKPPTFKGNLPSLEKLALNVCRIISDSDPYLLNLPKNLPTGMTLPSELSHLEIQYSNLEGFLSNTTKPHPKLQLLTLNNNISGTNECLTNLSLFPNLTQLRLEDNDSDIIPPDILKLKKLEYFDMRAKTDQPPGIEWLTLFPLQKLFPDLSIDRGFCINKSRVGGYSYESLINFYEEILQDKTTD